MSAIRPLCEHAHNESYRLFLILQDVILNEKLLSRNVFSSADGY